MEEKDLVLSIISLEYQLSLERYHLLIIILTLDSPSSSRLHIMSTISLFLIWACCLLVGHTALGLANCPTDCQCNDETLVVKCGEGHLDVLPIALNPSIQRLVIQNNKIRTIDSSIQFYAELTFLDLSYNHLVNIPSRTFGYQKKLRELHLNHNKIGSINNKTFTGMSSLTILNLRGNFIDGLDKNVFANVPQLEELNLGQNRLNRIEEGAFDGMPSLRVLFLDDNTLITVPSPALGALIQLAELYMGVNSFTTIPQGSFKNLTGLSRLNLRGAALLNISHESFKGLEQLRILDLSDNRLTRIPTLELSTLTRLEELSLGQNDFEVVPEGAFIGLSNLRQLDISGSTKLKTVEAGAFATNGNIESLTIASNKALTSVQEGALGGLPHLKHLILRDNALTTLAEGMFPWSELHTLDVSDNKLACDCGLLWLRSLLLSRNNSRSLIAENPVLCSTPERVRGESLRLISPEILGCNYANPQRQAMVVVMLVVCVALVTALAMILYRCRQSIRQVLNGGWDSSALSSKKREYQKTLSADEDFLSRYQHPCHVGAHHHHHQHKAIPVTDLDSPQMHRGFYAQANVCAPMPNYEHENIYHQANTISHIHEKFQQQNSCYAGRVYNEYTPPLPPLRNGEGSAAHHHHTMTHNPTPPALPQRNGMATLGRSNVSGTVIEMGNGWNTMSGRHFQ